MVSILHISDLHIIRGAEWNNLRTTLLNEAAEKVQNRRQDEKLLIITGDLHNFQDTGYQETETFLRELFKKMSIEPDKDVFVIPGNHDVGNATSMNAHFGEDTEWGMRQKSSVTEIKKGNKEFIKWRLESFIPYCKFVCSLGIYPIGSGTLPAKVHIRNWRGKLNILHLNSALISDGADDDGQLVDTETATSKEIWDAYVENTVPTLAIAHHSFYDLAKHQQTQLEAVFKQKNVSAYLGGDKHRKNNVRNEQLIRLTEGYQPGIEIPNLICMKSAADESDEYSEFGFYWYDWNEETDEVKIKDQTWKREKDQARTISTDYGDIFHMLRQRKSPAKLFTKTNITAPDAAPATQNNVQQTICIILELAGEVGIPCDCFHKVFYNCFIDIPQQLKALIDMGDVVKEARPAPYNSEEKLNYYKLAKFCSNHELNALLTAFQDNEQVRALLSTFFTYLAQKELLIEEDVVKLTQDAGLWYQNLLEWLPFCQQIINRPWPSVNLAAVLGNTYWNFLLSTVHLFYYMNDSVCALKIFEQIPVSSRDEGNLTEWLQNQAVYMRLLCAVGRDPHTCFMPVYRVFRRQPDLTEEQRKIIVLIIRMYAWALIGSDIPNVNEINEVLNQIREHTPLAFTEYRRIPVSPNELYRIKESLFGCMVVNISRHGQDFVLDIVGLPEGVNIRQLFPAVLKPDETFCCASKLPEYCDNPSVTCEECSAQNDRRTCSVCASEVHCDFYQAYSEMQHAFFLYKRTWENELPHEMALKGLRRGSYLAYGVFLHDKLLAYIDVKETWEDGKEIQTFGFAFTKADYRSQKLTHALINHVRLLHPRATFRMTTNQLNSSMLRCCRNLGFQEYAYKDDRIFPCIKTCCEELEPLIP